MTADTAHDHPVAPAQGPDTQRPDAHRPATQRPDAHRPDAQRPDAARIARARSGAMESWVRRSNCFSGGTGRVFVHTTSRTWEFFSRSVAYFDAS